MPNDKGKDRVTDFIANSTGAAIGGALGAVLAGPIGGAIGGLAGYGVQFGILKISEHMNRALSDNEVKKIATVLDFASKKIRERIEKGETPRTDGFFEEEIDDRSADHEIFEGVLFAAQQEHEEKKLPYMANLYANIAFDSSISRPEANQLIKISQSLSYRQLCIIQSIAFLQIAKQKDVDLFYNKAFGKIEGYDKIAIATEIFTLYSQGIISSTSAIFDPAGMCPAWLTITGTGAKLFQLMELGKRFKQEDLVSILALLTGSKPVEIVLKASL